MSEKFIEFKNVTYTYEPEEQGEAKPSPALCNIDLTVNRGEFVAVLGHNGSGKSTLAKLTNAILVPESGTVTVDGIDTSNEDRLTDIRRKVGMVFQNPDNQIVATIVEDDVAFGPENLGVAPDEIRRRVDDALKAVGMYDYRLREPHKLSGGQKQRLSIARAIAKDPKIYLFDDSFSALDYKTDVALRRALKAQTDNATVLIVAQRISTVLHANQILVLDEGRLVGKGTHAQLMASCPEYQEIARSQLSQKELDLEPLNTEKEGV